MLCNWDYMENQQNYTTSLDILSIADIAILKNFQFTQIIVDTDVDFSMDARNSSNPSIISVYDTGTGDVYDITLKDTASFIDRDETWVTYDNKTSKIMCIGSGPHSFCGENNLPANGTTSNKVVILKVVIQPQKDEEGAVGTLYNNTINWFGNKYRVWVKPRKCNQNDFSVSSRFRLHYSINNYVY